jgi:glycosyltransferase involved in cell wall biosynthesis
MKILFVSSNLNTIGGIQRYNKIFLQTLRELGINIKLVELKEGGLISKSLFVLNMLFKTLTFSPDIIICTHINFSPICYFLNKFFGYEYSVSVYGIEVAEIKSRLHFKSLKSAKLISNLFEQTADNVIRQIPEAKDKIVLLPNSIDGSKFFIKEKSVDLMKKHNLSGSKIIITVSRLSKDDRGTKGYDKVIRAMSMVVERVQNAKYLLVGGGGDRNEMENLVKELNLEGNIIFAGAPKNEEMVDYYNLADVFVFPSQKEGFPAIVLLEALACGKPIIGGEQPGNEKEIFKKDLGIIVDPNNIQAIADAIVKILTNKAPEHLYSPSFLRKRVLELYGLETYKKYVKNLIGRINK